MSVEVRGIKKIMFMLDHLPQTLGNRVRSKLHGICEDIRDDARVNCPVDTGSLKKSIRVFTYPQGRRSFVKIGVRAGGYIVNPKSHRLVDYAGAVEYGTSRQQAQPYLRPAVEDNKERLMIAMQDAALETLRFVLR